MDDRSRYIVFLIRKSPLSSDLPAAALDIALTAAAFGQKVALAFSGDGVLHLLGRQANGLGGVRNLNPALPELGLYDINEVLVDARSLADKGLREQELAIPVVAIDREGLARLLESADLVFNI